MDSSALSCNYDVSIFLALMSSLPGQAWYTTLDGPSGNFLAGINLPSGTATIFIAEEFLPVAERSGASLLPLPFVSELPELGKSVNIMSNFASR